MENPPLEEAADINSHPQIALIDTFCELTGLSSKQEALFYLESHVFDLDAAVSTFLDDAAPPPVTAVENQPSPLLQSDENENDSMSPSHRSRSPSPPLPGAQSYNLRSAGRARTGGRRRTGGRGGGSGSGGGIRTLSDLSRNPREDDGSDSDPDFDPQEYFTGGEKSGMLVQDPTRRNPSRRNDVRNDVEAIFDQARRTATTGAPAENSSSRNFAGTGRLLSGGTSSTPQQPQQPEVLNHNITFWSNGFTVDDGPLRRLEDPENVAFLESVKRGECPEELAPAGRRNAELHVNLTRREEDYKEPEKPRLPFQGAGRTLGSTADEVAEEVTSMELNAAPVTSTITAPSPTPSLVVDETQPTTSIQLRLADGTRIVSRFNNHHTIRDIRGFIDASRASAPGSYQLQSMGFPPKQLSDLDQTIDQAGIANSVVIQKL